MTKPTENPPKQESPFSYRPTRKNNLRQRFFDVVEVTKRTKASVLHECLDLGLPQLETRFAKELKTLKAKKSAG